jgi:molecular chaperone GrpE
MQHEDPARRALNDAEDVGSDEVVGPYARREIESVLSAFRQWLFDAEAWRNLEAPSDEHPSGIEPVDLHTVFREWIALKQELKLEARGSKAARECLDGAVEAFHGGVERVADEAKGLLDALVRERDRLRDEARDLRESEAQSWAEVLLDVREVLERAADACRRASRRRGWRRWLPKDPTLESLHEGYGLALKQLDAALESRGIRNITCENQPVDPHRMRVVDVVRRDDVSPGHVIEVIRRGYTWGSRVIRYAEVRAVAGGSEDSPVAAPMQTEPTDTTHEE